MRILFLFIILLATACAHIKSDDMSPLAASQAQYPTIELNINKQLYNGLALISLPVGSRWEDLNFSIQGYNEGQVRVTSNSCNLDYSTVYVKNALIRVPIQGEVTKDCVFGVSMGFKLPREKWSGIKVWPIIGWVVVKAVAKDEEWVGTYRKVTGQFLSTWKIKSGDTNPVQVFLNGCGVAYQKMITPKDGIVEIELSEAMTMNTKGICILDGVLISKDFANLRLNSAVVQYDPNFVPLSIPVYSLDAKGLYIKAEESVTIIGVDQYFVFQQEGTFTFDEGKEHVVRALTVKGRTILGLYKEGKWKWLQ